MNRVRTMKNIRQIGGKLCLDWMINIIQINAIEFRCSSRREMCWSMFQSNVAGLFSQFCLQTFTLYGWERERKVERNDFQWDSSTIHISNYIATRMKRIQFCWFAFSRGTCCWQTVTLSASWNRIHSFEYVGLPNNACYIHLVTSISFFAGARRKHRTS